MAATFPAWEYGLLSALGAPASTANLQALNFWAQSEGSVTNNPLATSGKGAGATKCVAQCGGGSPIYEYATEAEGVAQMAQFMRGSNSATIVAALKKDAGLSAIYQAVNQSGWCKGCQGGDYPEALASAAGGKAPGTSASVGTGAGTTVATTTALLSSSGTGDLDKCVLQLPGFLFFSGPCLLTKGGVKWLSGTAALVGGSLIGALGIVILAAAAGRSVGAGAAVRSLPAPVRSATQPSSDDSSADSVRTLGLGRAQFRTPSTRKADKHDDAAAQVADAQRNDSDYQARRAAYLRRRETVRRAGAPTTKSRSPRPAIPNSKRATPSPARAKGGRVKGAASKVAADAPKAAEALAF